MVRNYEIGKIETYKDQVFMRNVPLKVGEKNILGLTKSIANPIDKKTIAYLDMKPENLINEMRLKLTLPLLRGIDNDKDKRIRFFTKHTKFLGKSPHLNIFVIDLTLESYEKLNDEDINYLNYILTYEFNDIYVMPIVKFNGMPGAVEACEEYERFVNKMLESKNEMTPGDGLKIGISIPAGYSGARFDTLMSIYDKEEKRPEFVLMDFGNRKTTDFEFLGNTQRIMQIFKKKGKEAGDEEEYEKFFLYGYNARPFKKTGDDPQLAEDFCLIEMGFNSFGHQYGKRTFMPKELVFLYQPTWKSSRTFLSEDYKYHNLMGEKEKSEWDDWVDLVYGSGTSDSIPQPDNYSRDLVKRYNFVTVNDELSILRQGLIKNDPSLLGERLKNKEIPGAITKSFGKIESDTG